MPGTESREMKNTLLSSKGWILLKLLIYRSSLSRKLSCEMLAIDSLNHAFQSSQKTIRLRDSLAGNEVGALLGISNTVNTKLICIP